MLIDHIFPAVIGEKSTLRHRLFVEATASGMLTEHAHELISVVPELLANAEAFFDKMTGLWRYEFGIPYNIAKDFFWGTHMWIPVAHLFAALSCAYSRIPEVKRLNYLARLADPEKHQATLVEMIPPCKIDPIVPLDFEVAGLGAGNRTVDWVIRHQGGRTVLLDVKRRITDFIKQAEGMAVNSSSQVPAHDPTFLFLSVEQKFLAANPNTQFQGVWICTDIKQDEEKLALAFSALCANKVHFAILGDWESDAYVLARRPEDRQYLLNLFRIKPSIRFTF